MANEFAADFAGQDDPAPRNADGGTFTEEELREAVATEHAAPTPTAPPPQSTPPPPPHTADDRAVDRLINAIDQRMAPAPEPQREPVVPGQSPTGLTPDAAAQLQNHFPQQPPPAVETLEQQTQYGLYRTGQAMQQAMQQMQSTANIQQSENDARLRFSKEAVGDGFDYDTVVHEYVSPTLQQSPELQSALNSFDNPGNLSYFIGLAAKLSHEYNADPARAARAIAGSLKAPVEAARDLVGAAAQANRQPTLTPSESGQTAGGLMDLFQRAITSGDDREFERLDALVAGDSNSNDFA